jgi:hypothetical protein
VFDAVAIGVQRAEHDLAIEPQIEREVVPRACRDDHVRDVVAYGDGRNKGLRAIATSHPDHVGASGDRTLGNVEQVIADGQHDGFDTALLTRGNEIGFLRLAAARLRIDDQHGTHRRPDRCSQPRRALHGTTRSMKRDTSGTDGHDGEHDGREHSGSTHLTDDEACDGQNQTDTARQQCSGPCRPSPGHDIPTRNHEHEQSDRREHHALPTRQSAVADEHDRSQKRHEGHQGSDALAERRPARVAIDHGAPGLSACGPRSPCARSH